MSAPEGDVNVAEDFAAVTGRQPQAIRTALAVLRAVAEARGGITAGQLGAALRLPPATTYRIVGVLVREEYLARLPDGRGFGLGARAAELAAVVAAAGCACGRCAAGQPDGELRSRPRPPRGPAAGAGLTAARAGTDAA
jgi:IclR helix-turn-helix domain